MKLLCWSCGDGVSFRAFSTLARISKPHYSFTPSPCQANQIGKCFFWVKVFRQLDGEEIARPANVFTEKSTFLRLKSDCFSYIYSLFTRGNWISPAWQRRNDRFFPSAKGGLVFYEYGVDSPTITNICQWPIESRQLFRHLVVIVVVFKGQENNSDVGDDDCRSNDGSFRIKRKKNERPVSSFYEVHRWRRFG